MKKVLNYSLYPLLLLTVLTIIASSIQFGWDYKSVYWKTTLFLVFSLIALETIFPAAQKWSMSKRSFLRDLKYLIIDAPTIALTKAIVGYWAISYSQTHPKLLVTMPFWLEAIIFLLVFEFFQYWFHRMSHSGKGPIGRFLWRTHIAHHLPDRVYVVMHAVFHPLNALISTIVVQAPLILLGISPEAALAATLLIDLQSLISHFNFDIRAGFLNYIFIGAETHRYHHSANIEEAHNFGNTLAIWDIIFGTFKYRPGVLPEQLGVAQKDVPDSNDLVKVLLYPFRKPS